jgi:hypothetical protein
VVGGAGLTVIASIRVGDSIAWAAARKCRHYNLRLGLALAKTVLVQAIEPRPVSCRGHIQHSAVIGMLIDPASSFLASS